MASNSGQRSASSDRSKRGKDRSGARRGGGPKHRTPPVLTGAGARTASEKREAREQRLQERRRRRRGRLLLWTLGLIALLAAGWSVYDSDLFVVEHVEVTGTERLTEDAVRVLAAVPADATLLRFPAEEVRQRVEADPWVSSASVTRDFPDTMQIRVEEREPAALVDMMDEYLLVDADGYIIEVRSLEETTALVVIRDLDGLDPTPGRRSTSEGLHNALAILVELSPEMRSMVRAISARTIDETALLTTEGVEVFFGLAEDVAKKDAVARSILEAQAETVVFIDVRVVDRPLTRGLDD